MYMELPWFDACSVTSFVYNLSFYFPHVEETGRPALFVPLYTYVLCLWYFHFGDWWGFSFPAPVPSWHTGSPILCRVLPAATDCVPSLPVVVKHKHKNLSRSNLSDSIKSKCHGICGHGVVLTGLWTMCLNPFVWLYTAPVVVFSVSETFTWCHMNDLQKLNINLTKQDVNALCLPHPAIGKRLI